MRQRYVFFHYSDRKRKGEKRGMFKERRTSQTLTNVISCWESEQQALSSEEIQRQTPFIGNDLTCLKSPKFKSGICQGCSNVFSQSTAIKTMNGLQNFLLLNSLWKILGFCFCIRLLVSWIKSSVLTVRNKSVENECLSPQRLQ